MRRSQRRNNLQICPRRDLNAGGSVICSPTRIYFVEINVYDIQLQSFPVSLARYTSMRAIHGKYGIRKYLNYETCKISPSPYYFSTGIWQCIVIYYPSFYDKLPAELCCTSGDTHSQNGHISHCFVPTAMASCTFHSFKVVSGTAPLYPGDLI